MTEMVQENQAARQPRSTAVIVVGASVSGLQTAHKLQQSGISCLVLEASDHVGGQTLAHDSSFSVENHPRTYALATESGLVEEYQPLQGKAMLEGFDAFEHDEQPALSAEDAVSLFEVQATLDTVSKRADASEANMTVDELVSSYGASPLVSKLANMWTRTIFGLSSNNVSASDFLSHCASCGGLLAVLDNLRGQSDDFSISNASHKVAIVLAQRLRHGSIHLHQRVAQIEHGSGSVCIVRTEAGDVFHSTRVVLAGDPSMCGGGGSLQLQPNIAAAEKWDEMRHEQGFLTTVDVVFDHPWWRERGLSGQGQGLDGPIACVRPSSAGPATDDGGLYSLSCQIAGEQARGMWLWLMDEDERESLIVQHLASIFGGGGVPRPVQVIERDADPLVRGQQCWHMGGGGGENADAASDASAVWWAPEGGIHFAGAKTSAVWRGHLEGALVAGERAAAEVLAVIGNCNAVEMAPRL